MIILKKNNENKRKVKKRKREKRVHTGGVSARNFINRSSHCLNCSSITGNESLVI